MKREHYIVRPHTAEIVAARALTWEQLCKTPASNPAWRAEAAGMVRTARRWTKNKGHWTTAQVLAYWSFLRGMNRGVYQ